MKHIMPPADAELAIKVTYHAVARYVQRVIGISVPDAETPRATAEHHAAAAGVTIDAIRSLICTPAVAAAIRLGLPSIRTPDFVAVIAGGAIVTIKERKHQPRRLKMHSKNEGRRISHAYGRRRRKGAA
jgi:hypothetical protein